MESNSEHEDAGVELEKKVLCRKFQINLLKSLFGKPEHTTVGSMFVYGHTSTGKSYVIQSLLSAFKLPHILINCKECSSSRVLFEHILNNLPLYPSDDLLSDEEADEYTSCDDMTTFVRQLTTIVKKYPLFNQTFYIVLDKAERLREMNQTLLAAMLRLQELTSLNVCIILISEIVWEKFRVGTGFSEPFVVHFPDYSQKELTELMLLYRPVNCDEDVYSLYISIVLSVFYMVCRDLRELRHIARLNLAYFLEPIESGEIPFNSTTKLWRNVEPHLKKALKSVYLREVSSLQWEAMQQAKLEEEESDAMKTLSGQTRTSVELPYYSKFLLIAAYIASYNPMKYDKRFFSKHSGKTSRRSKLVKKNERASNHLLGPKVFPIDRLMAIFYSIIEGKVIPSAFIYMQISSLVSLNLLKQTGNDDKISSPRYKCIVSLDLIRSIARTVQFDIMRYLYDFL